MNKTNVIIKATMGKIIDGRKSIDKVLKPINEAFRQLSRLARKTAYV